MEPDQLLARQARRRHGLVTLDQARAAGLTDRQVDHRVRTQRWRRLASGVYVLAGAPVTFHQRALAAVYAAGPSAVASHTTAGHLLALSPFSRAPEAVHVLVPRAAAPRARLATVHRTTDLPPSDVATVAGIPVTRPARTLVDLAGCVPRRTLEEAVDDAVIRGLVTLDRLARRLAELRTSGRPGSPALDAVLATWHADSMPHELAEMRLTRRLVAAGVPPPVHQHEVHHHGRLVARLDLAWPHARVGYELDSRRWHSSPAAHQRDLVRHNALRALGWTVFQATPAQLRADGRELAAPLLAWFDNPRGGVQPCA